MSDQLIKIEITLGREDARALAQFCKRVTFDDLLRRTAGGNSSDEAYEMMAGIVNVQHGLHRAGFSPR